MSHARKRSRSISSSSADSISTISTGRSLSPKRARHDDDDRYVTSQSEIPDFPRYPSKDRKRRRKSSSSMSDSRSDSASQEERRKGNGRRRRRTISPEARGRPTADRRGSHRSRSRSRSVSMDKSRVAKERRSMTPMMVNEARPPRDQRMHSKENRPFRRERHHEDRQNLRKEGDTPNGHGTSMRKERSLSPYSKRIALTQAMNMGR
jgi:hypothetical protein